MKILDRYVLRSFLEPFFICFAGFIAIWLIIDIADNFNDFLEAHASFRQIWGYYIIQIPTAVLMAMPVAIMLGLLFCLSRMSRTNEIIAQLTAGRGLVRLLMPLIFAGLAATGFCFWLNYAQVPQAEKIKKNAMNQIKRGKKAGEVEPVLAHLFRDRQANRTWYVKKLRVGFPDLDGIHVTQQDAEGHITKKWYASHAVYDLEKHWWKIEKGMIINYTPEGDRADADLFPHGFRIIKDWTETPWRVASSEMNPSWLSVPELKEYLVFNADFPAVQLAPYRANLADRYALPFQCLIAVFLAAPLGIVYNRTGVIGGVSAALSLLIVMLLSHYLFVVLGKGLRIDPSYSPWIPNAALLVVGLILLSFRARNRDFPKFRLSSPVRKLRARQPAREMEADMAMYASSTQEATTTTTSTR